MTALTPRVEALEKGLAVQCNDLEHIEEKINNPVRGLEAAHQRIDKTDKLVVVVTEAVGVGKKLIWAVAILVIALLFNIFTGFVTINFNP